MSLLVLTVWVATANATLIGSTVQITSPHGNCLNVIVGATSECDIFDNLAEDDDFIRVDISDSAINFEFIALQGAYTWGVDPFDIVIDGLTWLNDPTAAIASISTNLVVAADIQGGLSPSAQLTGNNQITMTYPNTLWLNCVQTNCAVLSVDITPDHGSQVPVPATVFLLGLGLAGLGWSRRKKA